MDLIRPNGLIERLSPPPQPRIALNGYGRSQPGPPTATTMRLAARQERRLHARRRTEPLRGRLIDLTA